MCEFFNDTYVKPIIALQNMEYMKCKNNICSFFPDISFTQFIQSLIYAAERYGKLSPLKRQLLEMVIEYKDCVKACEHQHSKRSDTHIQLPVTRQENCKYSFFKYVITLKCSFNYSKLAN